MICSVLSERSFVVETLCSRAHSANNGGNTSNRGSLVAVEKNNCTVNRSIEFIDTKQLVAVQIIT